MLSCCSAFWLAQLAQEAGVPALPSSRHAGLADRVADGWLDAEAFFGWQDVLAADGILLEAVQDGEGIARICVAESIDQAHDFEPFLATRTAQSQTIK